jgi:spoIIIJ-associated protein
MQTVEISARTADEAKKLAADRFGVGSDDVKVTVIEETKGLFGRGSVRVLAEVLTVVAPAEPAPESKAPPEAKESNPPLEEKPEKKSGPKRGAKKSKPEEVEAPAVAAQPEAESADERADGTIVATSANADDLSGLLKELLVAADMQVSAHVKEVSGRYVNIQLDGKDAAFLVGKNGEVLNALQYLVNVIGGRRYDNGVRVTLDANDYRRRREEALTKLANKIADQVEERGEEAVLDALPAFERRVVHKALSIRPGISTYSEGEEPNRRVVIAPAD